MPWRRIHRGPRRAKGHAPNLRTPADTSQRYPRAVTSEAELVESYRAAETRLLAHYGLTATEFMLPVRGETTEIHGIDIPGDPSRPPVVLLHGAASVTAAAIPLIPAFDGRRVIAPDWPGHGLSSAAEFKRDELRARAVGWLDAVVTGLGLDTFELVGHSLGGQFALYYALAHPDRVDHLILLGAPGAAFGEMRAPFAFRVISLPWIGRGAFSREVSREQYGANSALTLGRGTVDAWPPELVDVGYFASLRDAFKTTLPFYYAAITGFWGTRKSSVVSHAELAKLSMPVLILWGDEDVFLVPERGAPSVRAIPDVEEVVLHAGHAPWLNKPTESAAAIRSFLAATGPRKT